MARVVRYFKIHYIIHIGNPLSGSGVLSLAYVAAGRLIDYFEPYMNIWDCAAGGLLVQEARGKLIIF